MAKVKIEFEFDSEILAGVEVMEKLDTLEYNIREWLNERFDLIGSVSVKETK